MGQLTEALRKSKAVKLDTKSENQPVLSPLVEQARTKAIQNIRKNPGTKYSMVQVDDQGAPEIEFALAISGVGSCLITMPKDRFDGMALIDSLERHG